MSDPLGDFQFGAIAIKLKFASLASIDECIRLQERMKEMGIPPKRLGEILVEKRYITETQLKEVMTAQASSAGAVQIGNYQILAKIGQGAMGSIYKARQISMDRIVALKILAPKYSAMERFRERFLREARAVARLNHPNIIQGIDVGAAGGIHYLAMEYVDGPTIGELLRRGGALEEKRALYICQQIARALDHAFRHGIIHRDIKPDNIMLTRDNVAKLCDLGLAKVAKVEDPDETKHGSSMGTPFYISPEQARGERDVDTRSDIYSLGASLYHMIVGEVPFPGNSVAVVVAAHLKESLPPPSKRNPLISPAVETVCTKMMQKERDKRFQTPQELLTAMEAALSGASAGPGAKGPEKLDWKDQKAKLLRKVRKYRRR